MFAVNVSPEKLRSGFSLVGAFVDQCTVECSEGKMKVSAVDTAQIGLVNMTVSDCFFETFEYSGNPFTVPLKRFSNVIELCVDVGEPVSLRVDEPENTLHVQCDGLSYSLSLVEPESVTPVPEIPEIDVSCSATFEAKELRKTVSAGNMFSDFVTFRSNNTRVTVSGGGENNVVLSKKNHGLIEFDGGNADSTFKTSYLTSILDEIDDGECVTVNFGVDCPAFVEFSPTNLDCSIEYVLAPRIKASD